MNIKNKFSNIYMQYALNSVTYFNTGFDIVKDASNMKTPDIIQVAIGNICIAVELVIKSFAAKIHPLLLFKNLPEDLRLYLLNSEKPPESLKINNRVALFSKLDEFETIDFSKCISLIDTYKPVFYKEFKNYFKDIVIIRNNCIHSSFHEYNKIHYDRFAYLAILLFEVLNEDICSPSIKSLLSLENIIRFKTIYKDAIAQRLHEKIIQARQKKAEKDNSIVTICDPFSEYPYECPICESSIIINGSTNAHYQVDEDGMPVDVELYFEPENFICKKCGLEIDDFEEFLLLDMDTDYDLSDYKEEWMDNLINRDI